jgi:hypothetical protein
MNIRKAYLAVFGTIAAALVVVIGVSIKYTFEGNELVRTADTSQVFSEVLNAKIAYHTLWEAWDFGFAQTVFWIALLASFAAAVTVSIRAVPRWIPGVLAALPGLMLTIESTTHHEQRGRWHLENKNALMLIRYDLVFGGISTNEAVQSLRELSKTFGDKWPALNPEAIKGTQARAQIAAKTNRSELPIR